MSSWKCLECGAHEHSDTPEAGLVDHWRTSCPRSPLTHHTPATAAGPT